MNNLSGELVKNKKVMPSQENEDNTAHRTIIKVEHRMDPLFLVIVIVLLFMGTVMIFSASYAYAKQNMGDSYYYLKKQVLWVAIGLVTMLLVSRISLQFIKRFSYLFYLIVFGIMVATAIPGIGTVHNGARRWIEFGPISFQPSELMKLAVVLGFSKYYVENEFRIKKVKWGIIFPMAAIGSICVVMYLQSHMSGMIILSLIAVCMMFIGGCSKRWLIGLGGVATAGVAAIFLTGYRSDRISAWLDPWKFARTTGYQTIQSLYAISQGGMFGVGIGKSMQKNLYLPEPQNDFIFSVWCEEMGLFGAIVVIALLVIFAIRGITIALRCPNKFASYVVIGIVIKVLLQAILNIAVVTNTIPNTGISLPFFSYGGTSLLFLMIEMGIVLSISRFSYIVKE